MSCLSGAVHLFLFSKVLLGTRYQIFRCSCGSTLDVPCVKPDPGDWFELMCACGFICFWFTDPSPYKAAAVALHSSGKLWNTSATQCSWPVGPKHTPAEIHYHLLPFAARKMKRQGLPVVILQCNGIAWNRSAWQVLVLEIGLLAMVHSFTFFFLLRWGTVLLPSLIFPTVVLRRHRQCKSYPACLVLMCCHHVPVNITSQMTAAEL